MARSSLQGSGSALSSAKNIGDLLKEKSIWEEFFDAHAPVYEDNVFTKNTIRDVDFLIEELSFSPGGSILDIGCGAPLHRARQAWLFCHRAGPVPRNARPGRECGRGGWGKGRFDRLSEL